MNTDAKDQARRAMQDRAEDWNAETDPHHARTPLPEKRYGPHPSGNRHERRKAAKLMRGK
jgi:hypothetical protein